jgi:hypothetical protein
MTIEISEAGIEEYRELLRGSPNDLRRLGFTVAVHNDYRLEDKNHTFWLLTRKMEDGVVRAFKGEGPTDGHALDEIRAEYANLTDDHHHAPGCAANHYHGTRAPTGPCTCGAVSHGVKMKG